MQRDPIAIDHAMAKVNAVAGKSDDPLDQDLVVAGCIGSRAKEDDGFIAMELSIGEQRSEGRRRRCESDALDENVIAN